MTSAKRKVEIAERPAQIPRKHRTIYDSRINENILIIDSGGAFRTFDHPELTISGHIPVFPRGDTMLLRHPNCSPFST